MTSTPNDHLDYLVRQQARLELPPELRELVERVYRGMDSRARKGFAIEDLEIYVADDLWSMILRLHGHEPYFDKMLKPGEGMWATIVGRPIHVDRSLNDGQARLRYELVI